MRQIALHDIVALMEDTKAQRVPNGPTILLRRGQVGTIIEELGGGEAFEVEFAQADGQAYAILAINVAKLMPLYYEPIELVTAR